MKLLAVVPLRSGGRIRWTARILGLLLALFVSFMVIGEVMPEPNSRSELKAIGVRIMFLWVAVSMLVAWRWEKLGGWSCAIAGAALGIFYFTIEDYRLLAAFMIGLPAVLVGVAFLAADQGVRIVRRKGKA
ncbi:MAG: hypothetical protein HY683_02210 [Chloroflexi bacterium]|nr:hypothetical protein [Chloroflexota bacterium]